MAAKKRKEDGNWLEAFFKWGAGSTEARDARAATLEDKLALRKVRRRFHPRMERIEKRLAIMDSILWRTEKLMTTPMASKEADRLMDEIEELEKKMPKIPKIPSGATGAGMWWIMLKHELFAVFLITLRLFIAMGLYLLLIAAVIFMAGAIVGSILGI